MNQKEAQEIIDLNERIAELEDCLKEWLNTPFFETKEEWQKWVDEFRPKVEAIIKNIEEKT